MLIYLQSCFTVSQQWKNAEDNQASHKFLKSQDTGCVCVANYPLMTHVMHCVQWCKAAKFYSGAALLFTVYTLQTQLTL